MPLTSSALSIDSMVLALTGFKLSTLFLGWARALPVVVIVPAFGLPRMSASLRSAIALVLAVAALPGSTEPGLAPSAALLTLSIVDGVAIAIPAALGVWIATMAGSFYDELGSSRGDESASLFGSERTATGTLFGFIAVIAFLAQGGPARMVSALTLPLGQALPGFARLTQSLVSGIGLGVTVAAPLVVAQVLLEVGGLLATRISPIQAVRSLVLPVQGFLRLVLLAVFLEWVFRALASRH